MKTALLAFALVLAAPAVQAAEFKLYDQPNAEPVSFCDRYTSLSLTEGAAPKALLVNRLGGSCEIAVFPNERQFDLTVTTNACGAKIYKGTRLSQGNGPTAIKIVDNRTMTCEIPVVSLVYVEETYTQGVSKLYSFDASSAEPMTLVCGMKDHQGTPYLTFIVTREAGAEHAGITYVRSAFFGSEEVQFEQQVPGCEAANVQTTEVTGDEIYVECNADGDAGFLSVSRQGTSDVFTGHMTFPNTGVEGYSDQSLAVTCQQR